MIWLPFPPSTNQLTRYVVRGGSARALKSERARNYAKDCEWWLRKQRPVKLDGPLEVTIEAYFPSRRGDVDNRIKAVLDVLQGHAFANDSQVERLSITRHIDKKDPHVEVHVRPLLKEAA